MEEWLEAAWVARTAYGVNGASERKLKKSKLRCEDRRGNELGPYIFKNLAQPFRFPLSLAVVPVSTRSVRHSRAGPMQSAQEWTCCGGLARS